MHAKFLIIDHEIIELASSQVYGGWFVPCRISVFSGRKRATRKPAKWWLFRVFAWRPFAPPHESTRHSTRRVFAYWLSYLRLAGRKVATQKHAKWWFWRVFAWRPFAPPGKDTTNRRRKGDAWKWSFFRVAGRKVVTRKHEKVTIWRVVAWRLFALKTR